MRRVIYGLIASFTVLFLVACSELRYYHQATHGQLSLLASREDVNDLVQSSEISEQLKEKLRYSQRVLAFSEERLHLTPGNAYQSYVDVERPFVIWNLIAAPELSLTPKTWCYPVIGCQSYRGFFDKQMAIENAQELQNEDWDVWLGGVSAYSTLGWFDDPLLSTFIHRDDADLAALLIHELSHRVLYIDGDTTFNESFATAVEHAGLKLWLEEEGNSHLIEHQEQSFQRRQVFIALVTDSLERLRTLYQQPVNDEIKRQGKADIIDQLKQRHEILKKQWGGQSPYQNWFDTPINNAKLATVASYHDYVPAFLQLLKEVAGDWPKFYKRVAELAELPEPERRQALEALNRRVLTN